MAEHVCDNRSSNIALSEGRHPYPVMRPGFKPGWGVSRSQVGSTPAAFRHQAFSDFAFWKSTVFLFRKIPSVPQNSLRGLHFVAASIAHVVPGHHAPVSVKPGTAPMAGP